MQKNIKTYFIVVMVSLVLFGGWFYYLLDEATTKEEQATRATIMAEIEAKESAKKAVIASQEAKEAEKNARRYAEESAKLKKQIEESEEKRLATLITKMNKKVTFWFARKIVRLSIKYEDSTFNRYDILALVGIESNFDMSAQSRLKTDPAIGLTQVRPLMWELDVERLKNNPDYQVKSAVVILRQYHDALGDKDKTLMAFNIGLQAVKDGDTADKYVEKHKKELEKLKKSI